MTDYESIKHRLREIEANAEEYRVPKMWNDAVRPLVELAVALDERTLPLLLSGAHVDAPGATETLIEMAAEVDVVRVARALIV